PGRTPATPRAPLLAGSMGSATRNPTCAATSPAASVCTAAWGGTNSGNTSYLARASTSTPYRASIPASTHTTAGKRRDQRTIAASTSVPAADRSFHPQQRCGADGDDALARHKTARDEPPGGERLEASHLAAHESGRPRLHVRPHLRALAQQCVARQDDSRR